MPVISEETFLALQDDNYFEHYGVPGMKWGVRKTREQVGHRTFSKTSKSKSIKKDKKVQKKILNKEAKEKINKGLTFIARLGILGYSYFSLFNRSAGRDIYNRLYNINQRFRNAGRR